MNDFFSKDDHLIIPKSILKQFMDEKYKKISCLSLRYHDNLLVNTFTPKSFHTKTNFHTKEFDDLLKKYETNIGKWRKKIENAIDTGNQNLINQDELKEFIVRFITIQFNRTVLADKELLNTLVENEKERYNNTSLEIFKSGQIPLKFLENKQNFFSKNKDEYAYYYQKIMTDRNNDIINNTYNGFKAYALYIPDNIKSTFLLTPTQFTPNDEFVRIVISPRIALALYKSNSSNVINYLTEEDVNIFFARTVETALSMSIEYQEIIGEKDSLLSAKGKLQQYLSKLGTLPEQQIILITGKEVIINDEFNILEIITSCMYLEPKYKKILIEITTISKHLLEINNFNEDQGLFMFLKWGFQIILIGNSVTSDSDNKIRVADSIDTAIEMFL